MALSDFTTIRLLDTRTIYAPSRYSIKISATSLQHTASYVNFAYCRFCCTVVPPPAITNWQLKNACAAAALSAARADVQRLERFPVQVGFPADRSRITFRLRPRRPPPRCRPGAGTRPAAARCTCRAAVAQAEDRPRGRSPETGGTHTGAGTHRCRAPTSTSPAPAHTMGLYHQLHAYQMSIRRGA